MLYCTDPRGACTDWFACYGALQVLLEGLLILALHNRPASPGGRGGQGAARKGGESPGTELGMGAVGAAVYQRQTQLFLLGALPVILGSLASPSGDVSVSAGYTLARLAPALGYASVRGRSSPMPSIDGVPSRFSSVSFGFIRSITSAPDCTPLGCRWRSWW